jgi:PIN domain nuclease of toxin-antitoxin system
MSYLLDTNIFLWAASDPKKLSRKLLAILMSPEANLFLSIGSVWEIVIKSSLRRLKMTPKDTELAIKDLGVTILNITLEDLETLYKLPPHHKDPFDRLIISQALTSSMTIMTTDLEFKSYSKLKVV